MRELGGDWVVVDQHDAGMMIRRMLARKMIGSMKKALFDWL